FTGFVLNPLLSIWHVNEVVTVLVAPPPLPEEYPALIVRSPSMTLSPPISKLASAFGLPDNTAIESALVGEPVAKIAPCLVLASVALGAADAMFTRLSVISVPLLPANRTFVVACPSNDMMIPPVEKLSLSEVLASPPDPVEVARARVAPNEFVRASE